MKKPKRTVRDVPVPMSKVIELDFVNRFTWLQRLQIAIGYNATIRLRILCRHSPGEIKPLVEIKTTPEKPS